jgi:caprin-1
VEGKSKEILGTTYAKLKELVTAIHACGYFDQSVEETSEEQAEEV